LQKLGKFKPKKLKKNRQNGEDTESSTGSPTSKKWKNLDIEGHRERIRKSKKNKRVSSSFSAHSHREDFGNNFIEKNKILVSYEYNPEFKQRRIDLMADKKKTSALRNKMNRMKITNKRILHNMLYTVKNDYKQIQKHQNMTKEVNQNIKQAVRTAWVMNIFFYRV
jgi:hypothetical protein